MRNMMNFGGSKIFSQNFWCLGVAKMTIRNLEVGNGCWSSTKNMPVKCRTQKTHNFRLSKNVI